MAFPSLRHSHFIVRASVEKEDIVSKKDEPKGIRNVPDTEATLTSPSHSPTFSLRAILSHPSKDKPPPLLLTETEPLQPPKTKTVVSKEGKSAKLRSPLCLANPMPPRRSAPISPKSAVLHLSKDKTSPIIKLVPTRCEPSAVNKNRLMKVSTHQRPLSFSTHVLLFDAFLFPILARQVWGDDPSNFALQ